MLRARRPNRYGYVLLAGGFLSVFALGGLVRSGQTWLVGGTLLGAVVGIAAGLALIRRRPADRGNGRG